MPLQIPIRQNPLFPPYVPDQNVASSTGSPSLAPLVLVVVVLLVALTAQWWWPALRRIRRTSVGAALLVLGSGFLVAGMMDSNTGSAAFGSMMLVSGFLLLRKRIAD